MSFFLPSFGNMHTAVNENNDSSGDDNDDFCLNWVIRKALENNTHKIKRIELVNLFIACEENLDFPKRLNLNNFLLYFKTDEPYH